MSETARFTGTADDSLAGPAARTTFLVMDGGAAAWPTICDAAAVVPVLAEFVPRVTGGSWR